MRRAAWVRAVPPARRRAAEQRLVASFAVPPSLRHTDQEVPSLSPAPPLSGAALPHLSYSRLLQMLTLSVPSRRAPAASEVLLSLTLMALGRVRCGPG